MKLRVSSGEQYPHLFVSEPTDDYGRERAYDVPEGIAAAVLNAQRQLSAAEQALLVYLRDHAGVPPAADIIAEHLYEDDTSAST